MEEKKKLYIAKTFLELKDKYVKDVEYDSSKSYSNYVQASQRLHEAILTAENGKDDERLYCLSMRYSMTYFMLMKQFPGKRAELKNDIPHVTEAIQNCENLMGVLKKRYSNPKEFKDWQEKDDENEWKRTKEINNNEIKLPVLTKINKPEVDGIKSHKHDEKDCLTAQEFYKLQKENNSLLVFDLRDENDWRYSKLMISNQINIPESFLVEKEVVTAKDIELCLDEDSRALWNARDAYEAVVFVDWWGREHQFVEGGCHCILRNCLLKWSPDVEMKAKPLILSGGFADVAELYPNLVSNIKVSPPKFDSEIVINGKLALSKLTLKDEEETKNDTSAIIGDQKFTEQKPSRSVPPAVDRSKKPKEKRVENGNAFVYPSIPDELAKPTFVATSMILEPVGTPLEIPDSVVKPKSAKVPSIPDINRSLKPKSKVEWKDEPKMTESSDESNQTEVEKLLSELKVEREKFEKEKEARQMWEEKSRQLEKEKEELYANHLFKEKAENVKRTKEDQNTNRKIELETLRAKKPPNLADDFISQTELCEKVEAEPSKDTPSPRDSTIVPTATKEAPEKSTEGDTTVENTYYQELRDDSSSSLSNRSTSADASGFKRGALKRTNSSPNLAKNVADLQRKDADTSLPVNKRVPSPRRDRKPMHVVLEIDGARLKSLQPVYGSVVNGKCGLRNLGNTCYMNACLQCLSHTYLLREYIIRGIFYNKINPNNKEGMGGFIVSEFTVLLRALWNGKYKVVSPIDVKQAMARYRKQFYGTNQQDAQELLTALLDGLHEEVNMIEEKKISTITDNQLTNKSDSELANLFWNNYSLNNRSIIVDLFQGQYRSVVECKTCGKKSTAFDTFMYLSLPIPSNIRQPTLIECMKLYCSPEIIEWNCPMCKCLRKASKKLDVWRWPRYLIIHLKRFQFSANYNRVKIQTKVLFPFSSQMDPQWRAAIENEFMLYGVVQHSGSIDRGHYVANVLVASQGQWYKFDDNDVSSMSRSSIVSENAYLLFYAHPADIR